MPRRQGNSSPGLIERLTSKRDERTTPDSNGGGSEALCGSKWRWMEAEKGPQRKRDSKEIKGLETNPIIKEQSFKAAVLMGSCDSLCQCSVVFLCLDSAVQ